MNRRTMIMAAAVFAFAAFIVLALPMIDDSQDSYAVTIDGYDYDLNESDMTAMAGNTGYTGDVVIPQTVEFEGKTYTVTKLKFTRGNNDVTSFTLPATITELTYQNIARCNNLTKISAPGVTKLGPSAVSDNPMMSEIELGNLTVLPNDAFKNCKSLVTMDLPGTYTRTGTNVFMGCSALRTVTLSDTVTYIGANAFQNTPALETVTATGVTEVYTAAFKNSAVRTVNLGDMETIGRMAFNNTPNLTVLNFNKTTVKEVGGSAFLGCGYPDPLVFGTTLSFIPESDATSFSVDDGVTIVGADLFNGNTKITTVSIAESVVEIGANAFRNCTELTTVEFRGTSSLALVGDYAFSGDAKLTSISLPENAIDFGKSVFDGTALAQSIAREDSTGLNCLIYAHSVAGDYTVAPGIDKINYGAFDGNNSKAIIIDSGVSVLDRYAVAYSNAEKIVLNNPDTVLETGCFSNSPNLTEVVLPETLTFIPESGFTKCTSLVSFKIPDACTNIYSSAFSGCTSLKNVTMNCTPFLDRYAFQNTALESVTLKPGMTDGNSVFSKCTSLREVVLEEGITYLGYGLFSGCTSLTSVTLPDSLREIDQSVFSNTGLETITVPAGVTSVKGFLVNGAAVKSVVFEGSFELTSNNFGNCDNLQYIEFMGQYGSSGRYIFNFTEPFEIKIHNPTAFDSDGFTYRLKNPVMTDEAAGIEYIDVTYVMSGGQEIQGRYALSCTADRVVLGPEYVGFVPSILSGKQFAIDPANPVLKDDGTAVYGDGKLVLLRDCASYEVRPGTVRLNSYALDTCASLTSLYLPDTVASVGADALMAAPGLKEVFLSSSVEGLEFPDGCRVYYEYGTYDPAVAGDRFDGYFLDLTAGRIVLEASEPTFTVDGPVMTENVAAFGITPIEGYTDSVFQVTMDGKALAPVVSADNVWIGGQRIDGKYVIRNVSGDMHLAVDGIVRNTYDITVLFGAGFDVTVSPGVSDVPYGTVASVQVLLKDGYSKGADFSVTVNGAPVQYTRTGDRGVQFVMDVTEALTVDVSGIEENASFQVSFDTNGGDPMGPQTVVSGAKARYAVPTYTGHIFMGWFSDEPLSQLYDFDTPVAGAVTLYAKWADDSVTMHKVTFSSDRGTVSALVNGGSWIESGNTVPEGSIVTFYAALPMNTDVVSWTAGEVSHDSVTKKTYTVTGPLTVSVATDYTVSGTSGYRYDIPVFTEENYVPLWTVSGGDVGSMGSTIPPAVLNDRIYYRSLSVMYMVDANNGQVLKQVETGVKFSGFYAFCSTGNEMVIDGFGGKVYDKDLNLLYTLSVCNIKAFYYQDMIFVPSEGTMYAYSAVDQDPGSPDNVQTPVWSVRTDTFDSPYAGGSTVLFQDDWLLTVCLIGGETYLKTFALEDGSEISSVAIPEFRDKAINIGYMDLNEGYATLTVYGSGMFDNDSGDMDNVASVRVDDDGVFNTATLKVVNTHTGSGYCSALIVSGGLGFVVANGCVQVYDMETMELMVQSEQNRMYYGHNSMMISDATPDKVIGYMVSYNSSSSLFGFEYTISENTIRLFELKNAASQREYSSAIPRMLENGCVIFYNDSNCVFCVAPAVTVTLQHNNGLTETMKVAKGSLLDMGDRTYLGVYSDQSMSVEWNMETAIDDDTVVYVKNELKSSSIVFNDGASDILTLSGYVGGPIDAAFPALSKVGYTAVWKDAGGKVWKSMPSTFTTEGETKVTLNWVPNSQTLTVIMKDPNGTEIGREYYDCDFGDVVSVADVTEEVPLHTYVGADKQTLTVAADDSLNVFVLTYRPFPVITWSVDGTETQVSVQPGTVPAYPGAEPVRESTVESVYAFTGWDPAVTAADGDAVYTAVFAESARMYTVSSFAEDGTTPYLQVTVPYGGKAVIDGAPSKLSTAKFSYAFDKWVNLDGGAADLTSVKGDMSVKASYEPILNSYTVTYQKEDGSMYRPVVVPYGSSGVIADAPAKAADAQYTYVFDKWVNPDGAAADLTSVMGDMTVKATYTSVLNQYNVVYRDADGGLFRIVQADYGAPAVMEDVPAKASTAEYDYAFDKWMAGDAPADLTSVKGDMEVTASYTETARTYTVTYDSAGGSAVAPSENAYGTTFVLADAPTKAKNAFTAWKAADGTLKQPGETVAMPAGDLVFEAVWTVAVGTDDVDKAGQSVNVEVGGDTANISGTMVSDITSDKSKNVTLKFGDATVVIPAKSLDRMAKDSGGNVKDLSISVTSSDSLDSSLVSKVSGADKGLVTYRLVKVISVDVDSSGPTSGLGSVVISVPYALNGQDPASIVVNYIDSSGRLTPVSDVVYKDGMLSFTTSHFSDFAVSFADVPSGDTEPGPDADTDTDTETKDEKSGGEYDLYLGLVFGILIGAGLLFVFMRVKN